MCTGEANYFRYYKGLGVIAKLATSYCKDAEPYSSVSRMLGHDRTVPHIPRSAAMLAPAMSHNNTLIFNFIETKNNFVYTYSNTLWNIKSTPIGVETLPPTHREASMAR